MLTTRAISPNPSPQLPHDSWAVPLSKILIDQTLWSVTWNTLYFVLLGAMRVDRLGNIVQSVRSSWLDVLKAGWRFWPLVHVLTYGMIPMQHRLLFVDAMELVWVGMLSFYGQQQRRKHEVAAAELEAKQQEKQQQLQQFSEAAEMQLRLARTNNEQAKAMLPITSMSAGMQE
jgi:protein Mpv17